MSEYQYYEFQTLDHPMTPEALAEMRSLSSRVQLTPTSAKFTYNYGNFRGDPYNILAQHFDAMLYITNWGTRQLMFRFPQKTIPAEVMAAYQHPNGLTWSAEGGYIILNIERDNENGDSDWLDDDGLLGGLTQARNDILSGDYRALYLAWLVAAESEPEEYDDDDDEGEEDSEELREAPVPPGLKTLSSTLKNIMVFFEIDPNLVKAAAQTSPAAEKLTQKLGESISLLSDAEKHDFLRRLLDGEPRLNIALTHRLRELSGAGNAQLPSGERRTFRQLVDVSEALWDQQQAAEKQKSEQAHLKKLESLAPQEAQLWAKVAELIAEKKVRAYDEAIPHLVNLRDLLTHQGRVAEFQAKLTAIKTQYPTLTGLHTRLRDNKLQ